jgi:hypothetical protein
MLKYGMVGEIADFSRVVAWDFDQEGIDVPVLEKEVQLFVPDFVFSGGVYEAEEGSGEEHAYRLGRSNEYHMLNTKEFWLVYFFESKQLRKYPVKEAYHLFKRAF